MDPVSEAKDFKERTLRTIKGGLCRLWRRKSVNITEYDPSYKVFYLGNVLTGWAKGEGCVDKPLHTLWKNYQGSCKPEVQMKVTVSQSGLKAVTKQHGLTEYWSNRITFCTAPQEYPGIFCWVYRHEGRRLKQELRCHAVLCHKESVARRMAQQLRARLAQALVEFKRDKLSKQNARLSLANAAYENPSLPRRKILLSTGSHNYRPPLERSKSAPKLMSIEESLEEEEEPETRKTSLPDRFSLKEKRLVLPKLEEEVELDPCGEDVSGRVSWSGEDLFGDTWSEGSEPEMLVPKADYVEEDESLQSISSAASDPKQPDSGEEDSDESGFVEPPSLQDDKVRDLPHHHLVKNCLIPTPNSPCLQV